MVDAEAAYDIDYEDVYVEPTEDSKNIPIDGNFIGKILLQPLSKLKNEQLGGLFHKILESKCDKDRLSLLSLIITENNLMEMLEHGSISSPVRHQIVENNFKKIPETEKSSILDSMFKTVCKESNMKQQPNTFVTLSIQSMTTLEKKGKPNLLFDLAKCLGTTRPNSDETLLPMNRMPFGLIQHQLQFFSATDVRQVTVITVIFMFNPHMWT